MSQVSAEALQWVVGPVLMVPAQEPAGEGRWFESLFDRHCGGSGVSVGGVALYVPGRYTGNTVSC